ncbi:leucyl aminopeptidase [Wenzhouxiangella sp. XN79A]|uniref:leucyl aminopeptidase n=1 Tax=Wenzhouxiangella sp. XN79A TaxID=2724193 RepID=UPI00144A82A6|nr:leucyl aminopeptidase [Wenzhouxiangella sp. XN79A]NKI35053.1 leucyl aminopeptidase [Wenzhouxiangella sp. XN79A]
MTQSRISLSPIDADPVSVDTDCLVIGLMHAAALPGWAGSLNEATGGLLERLREAGELPTSAGRSLMLHEPDGLRARRLLIVGLGKPGKWTEHVYAAITRAAGQAVRASRARSAHCLLPLLEVPGRDDAWKTFQAAIGMDHGDYVYTATRTPRDDDAPPTESVTLPAIDGIDALLTRADAVNAGVRTARDLADLPPNICTPAYLAERATQLAEEIDGLEVEVLEEDAMIELGMNALMAVGKGSVNRPRLIRLRWTGGSGAPYALVGKGVTFDTGGISLKPRELMEQMKFDMGGAAATIGALEAVARMKLPLNVDGVVAAVENMPDAGAYRPGDVITSMAGKTIEVHNTDAEGRMILADALTWTERNSKPAAMVDIATLTGACVVALGHHASGIMTRDDELAEELLTAGLEASDRGWRLPLWDEYQKQIETPFADMKNIGGMPAGSITAGCFLSRFVEDTRWAHIDIAGSAWQWGKPESATGRPVGLLVRWLIDRAG